MKYIINFFIILGLITTKIDLSYSIEDNENTLIINSTIINNINENFLSIALDTIVIAEKFKNFNMSDERLIKLTSYLSPGFLRIGGNLADRLYFSKDDNNEPSVPTRTLKDIELCEVDYCAKNLSNFTMTGSEWKKLNKFAKDTGFTIIFDLNCLIRNDDGSWNSKNAEEIIEFSDKHEFDLDWQLGNEPNAFRHMFNYSVNATQLANDFIALRALIDKYPRYKKSLLIGPDVTRPRPQHKESQKYLEMFLNASKKHSVNVVGWHQYYLNGREASMFDFLNPETFKLLETQISKIKEITNATGYNNTPIWLTETSSAYGGGAKGLSDTYIASFLWLDKLGLAAKHGLKTVIRQSLYHGYYALIDEKYDPSPDWWISYIYKKYVGPEVFPCDLKKKSDTVRLYCHCLKTPKNSRLQNSAVVIYGINIDDDYVKIKLKGIDSKLKVVFEYIFTSRNLQSKYVYLNEQKMKLSKEGNVPFYKPQVLGFESYLYIPPYSVVFWVIPADNMCNTKEDISAVQV